MAEELGLLGLGERTYFLCLPESKQKEVLGYGKLITELKEAFPDAFKQLKTSRGELVRASIGTLPNEPGLQTVREEDIYYALLLTEFGFYHIGYVPAGANLQSFIEALMPVLRDSFAKEVPDEFLELEDKRAVPHPEYGTRKLTLTRMVPNNPISVERFRNDCIRFQELAEQRRNPIGFAALPGDTAQILEQLTKSPRQKALS